MGDRGGVLQRAARGLLGAVAPVALWVLPSACSLFPDELNLSPLYRHRVDPEGNLVELDFLWPIIHWAKDESGSTDTRLRPLWRRVDDATGTQAQHQFLVPLGTARSDPEEDSIRLLPLLSYRNRWHMGEPEQWDIDWWFTPLIWGGSSATGEDYLAVIPIYGTICDFLTYDRLGFFLFPLHLWTERGDTTGNHFLWPLIGWGGADDPKRPHWWRVLPFYGESIRPGEAESYTVLWPFFNWGRDRLHTEHPNDKFFFFPLIGWKSGGAFLSWTFLWPFFRHGHKVDNELTKGEEGDFYYWDFPWPIFRIRVDTWSERHLRQFWLTPFVSSTRTKKQDSLVLLFPFLWFRRFWDKIADRSDTFILPFFWKNRIRYKKSGRLGTDEKLADDAFEEAEDFHWRLYPFADWREERNGNWRFRTLDPYPFEGQFAGFRPTYDFVWTLFEATGDARGNGRVRTFANVYASRNFAGRRFQSSVPFLFNYESDEQSGVKTLRLLQVLPIRWGGKGASK